MLLAVAGLEQDTIAERTQRLADGDWATFPPSEQAAYAFARQLSLAPASISQHCIDTLIRYFGLDRALDVIWWACRCHYMTRVADGFQLPLERDNVFIGYFPPKPNTK